MSRSYPQQNGRWGQSSSHSVTNRLLAWRSLWRSRPAPPQLCDSRVVAEHAALDEHVDQGRGHGLADRIGVEHGVRLDRTPGRRVGGVRDGVYHLLAVPVYGDLQAPLRSRVDKHIDGFLDLLLNV